MTSRQRISVGDLVEGADGSELGKVKEVGDSCFKVSVPKGRDYWLPKGALGDAGNHLARLRFDKDHLGEARIVTEEHEGAHQHGSAGHGPSLLGVSSRLLVLTSVGLMLLGSKER